MSNKKRDLKTLHKIDSRKLKASHLYLKISHPYFGGELASGQNVIIELPKRKQLAVLIKKKRKNPDRVNVWTIPLKEGYFNITYYKNTNKFFAFYRGGVHLDETHLDKDYLRNLICTIWYILYNNKKPRGVAVRRLAEKFDKVMKRFGKKDKNYYRKYRKKKKEVNTDGSA